MTADWQVLKQQPAPWRVPRRWRVRRVDPWLSHLGQWLAHPPSELYPYSNKDADTHFFATHAEALAYADQRARTMTATLPRVSYGDHVVTGRGLYSLHVEYVKHATSIFLGGWEGVHIPNNYLMDLAVYLAACAKHWEETQ